MGHEMDAQTHIRNTSHLIYRNGIQPLHKYLEHHANTRPDAPAVVWYGRTLSYAELNEQVDRFAVFLDSLGVRKGDRVALFLQNCPQYFIAHYAIQKLGAIVGPCSPMFKEWELEYEVNDLGATVLVTADVHYEIVNRVKANTELKSVVVTSYGEYLPENPTIRVPDELLQQKRPVPHGAYDMTGVLANPAYAKRPPEIELGLDDVALMVYTSGTTGMPKGAMLTYGNALFKTAAGAQSNQVTDSDVLLAVMPLFHIAGMLMGLNIPIYTGDPVVLLYRFDAETILQAIDHYRCTWFYSTAPMNVAAMKVESANRYNLTSLHTNICTSFGIQLTKELSDEWHRFTGGCMLYEAAYGLSETHTGDTYMPREAIKWGTHGVPTFETQVRIVDPESGKEVETGEMGEIVIRNPGVFKGYWQKPEATVKTLRDGWVYTGDMGFVDDEGYLTFTGRIKEMMKVSGYSVFPEDVELMLIRHPAIMQAAVIGVPDDQRGEVVKAFVVLKPEHRDSVTPQDIIEWSKQHMAAYKYPRYVEFREVLPASGTGKLLRRLLRENP
ncbi:AMP-binding protein [Alicyclobacillus tolerans]|uniref:AMP-binding protein n=1 Tax=Alicyclobacillus tolerans TaxID=90970 RepID=UPI001F477D47|nr:AMP-binding protein [Alicyclobacillus tolerans]MCF8568358.1 AMP-binding protein [Alicyclobacillus tolerans]